MKWVGRRLVLAILGLCLGLANAATGGCSASASQVRIDSREGEAVLAPPIVTAVYTSTDWNTADVYLSDLPVSVLTNPANDLRLSAGTVVHIHMFIYPESGRIPVGKSACNSTIRCAVLVGGGGGKGAGVYGGGGFILPDQRPGKETFSGSVRDSTLLLLRKDETFRDRLGPSDLTGEFAATRDQAAAAAIGARLDVLVSSAPEVAPAEAKQDGTK